MRIQRDNGPDLVFTGTLLARVDSRARKQDHREWTEIEVWRTRAGELVAVRRSCREPVGPVARTAERFDHMAEVAAWLGWSWLTRQLYAQCGYRPEIRVD